MMRKVVTLIAALLVGMSAFAQTETNPTASPDSSYIAYTCDNDLYVRSTVDGSVTRLTTDGSELILNGYASWVYYEEILGRPSRYKAFWWSPDSRKIAFYRFDNSCVPMFPIYSPFGQYGSISATRYPKAGDSNPEVKIGIISLDKPSEVVWADFDPSEDQYFGTPFWGDDSQRLFVQWMPRVQQELRLYAVSAADGSLSSIYKEKYRTWVNWMDDMLFGKHGLYMVRDFETGWQQIYYLSYDGKTLKRLTSGQNWRVSLLEVDEKTSTVYFLAHRDSDVKASVYSVDRRGRIRLLSDPKYHAAWVSFAPDHKSFEVSYSNLNTPTQRYRVVVGGKAELLPNQNVTALDKDNTPRPEIMYLEMEDGLSVPAVVTYPKDFDPSKKYPVIMEIYGGPDTPYVRDQWRGVSARARWCWENGYIKVVADSRAAGHNGRAGVDLIYRDLTTVPVADFCRWAELFKSFPFVSEIGVEGFSFGGTMTTMLVTRHGDLFKCGIAGGGVYDWTLYDSHYTERFMDTPQRNPEGYKAARALEYIDSYDSSANRLKLTHGTGDDNVHFQNTLQLIDALQRAEKQFDLMIYPDGMHGYRGAQAKHDIEDDKIFWETWLK